MRLSPEAREAGHRLHVYDSLGSTNAEALSQADRGEPGPLWIAAHRQNAGRGRRGASWISPEGNLAASLLWPVADIAPDRVATLGFVAGLALADALDDVAASHSHPPLRDEGVVRTAGVFRLKWPNDVLANGEKLAGILLEAAGRRAVVIGFGVNVLAAPDGLPYATTSLASLGCDADAAGLLAALSRRFVEAARIWNKGHGFSSIRARWLQRAAGVGAPVTVRLPDGVLHGLHDGIDEGGRLIILAPDGTTHTVTAGEVHFGGAATAA